MPFQAIEPRRLYRQIADQLRSLIERGEFPVGGRLPPERDLAMKLGVSRPSVREALIALEVEGWVEIRMGSGIYVRQSAPPAPNATPPADGEGPLETIRARQVIESELAALAAEHPTTEQIEGLREAIAMMEEEAAGGQVPIQGDRLFHLRIAEMCDNAVLRRVVGELFDERHSPLFVRLGSHFETAQSWRAAIAEHRAVVEAIASGSPEAARTAMHEHLSRSHDRFTVSWSASGEGASPAVPAATPITAAASTAAPARKPRRRTA